MADFLLARSGFLVALSFLRVCLLALLFLWVLVGPQACEAQVRDDWDPWEFRIDPAGNTPTVSPSVETPASELFSWSMWVYRNVVGPVKGKSCQTYPSCSQYGADAVREHGLLRGFLYTCDRLHRCGHDRLYYEPIYYEGWTLSYDSVPR